MENNICFKKNSMENNFVPYEQALALKEIGFNGECFGVYLIQSKEFILVGSTERIKPKSKNFNAPTFSQAFRWFRENYNLCSWVYQSNSALYHHSILKEGRYLTNGYNNQTSYEESELECLKKLIEIVKN